MLAKGSPTQSPDPPGFPGLRPAVASPMPVNAPPAPKDHYQSYFSCEEARGGGGGLLRGCACADPSPRQAVPQPSAVPSIPR